MSSLEVTDHWAAQIGDGTTDSGVDVTWGGRACPRIGKEFWRVDWTKSKGEGKVFEARWCVQSLGDTGVSSREQTADKKIT